LFYSNTDDPQEVKYWVKKDFVYIRQKGSDLGERMKNAFGELYDRKYEKVLIIGSDVPDISKSFIENAFESLSLSNVVISPSDDGGYSLLGTDNFYPGLFSDIRWSTNSVLEKTIEIVKSLNLNMLLLPHLNDIDTVTELSKWLEKSNESSMAKKINTIAERENIKLLSKN
jgi:rSAM/selenodomain-associated transferase 1